MFVIRSLYLSIPSTHSVFIVYRVKIARSELEAVTKLQSLEECMDSLTPEWLKSLILGAPPGTLETRDVATMVEKNPDSCLNLLQVNIFMQAISSIRQPFGM